MNDLPFPSGSVLVAASERPRWASAGSALTLLLLLNLLCYADRYIIASITPALKREFLPGDQNANAISGLLTTAFLMSYMIAAPVCGWLADRFSRWLIIGASVLLWTLASGATGLATSFTMLICTRIFLGIGEAGYGPAAPTILSDLYPIQRRGRVLAWFFMAIPVGSALGYAFGGMMIEHWRWAFYLVVPPGLLLAALSARMREPRLNRPGAPTPTVADYAQLLRIPSLVANVFAQAAMTFAIGGLSAWAPTYLAEQRGLPESRAGILFGCILALGGLLSTLFGGWLGDRLRSRFKGAYFLVSGTGMLLGFPAALAMLWVPFPYAWGFIFLAVFFLFMNIGPANTALANVTPPSMRATAFAVNIFVIHALGDAISPPLMGWITDRAGNNWHPSFILVSAVMLVAGVLWLASRQWLVRDTEAVESLEAKVKVLSLPDDGRAGNAARNIELKSSG
jgi:MFS family permease